MKERRISDLLDLSILRQLADAHYKTSGVPIGVVDAFDGSLLVGIGWQDICILYHRAHPVTRENCRESDNYIKRNLKAGEVCAYKCKNGLWDIGVPIIAGGVHLATLFLGQFFYKGETPDRDFFVRQAWEYCFDRDAYLAALDQVPAFTREKVEDVLNYNKALAGFISDLCERALRQMQAEELARVSLQEKEILLKEIHHRVKNNLQIVSTLLDLQSGYLTDERTQGYFRECQERIMSIALVHEKLYQSEDLALIDFSGYIRSLASYLISSYLGGGDRISVSIHSDKVSLPIDKAIPCGLIINELICNALKHAFPKNREGIITISLHSAIDGFIHLRVSDNGVGLPSGLDVRNTESLGLKIVNLLSRQLHGTFEAQSENGAAFLVCFRSANPD